MCETPKEIIEIMSNGEFEADSIIFNEWSKVGNRVQKLSKSIEDVEDISSRLSDHVQILKKYIHVKRIQNHCFNKLKSNLKPNEEIFIQVDYSENYVNKEQDQIKSAYFGQTSFSIFTACCYVKVDDTIINESITVTSEASDYSRSAAMSRWKRVLFCIKEKYNLADFLSIHI